MKEIREIIEGSSITARAKQTALKIFEILAQAESKAHGVPVEEVHFHEVGAVDSIVDIVSIAVCLDDLDITDVIVPVLYDGTGFIRCQHGRQIISNLRSQISKENWSLRQGQQS